MMYYLLALLVSVVAAADTGFEFKHHNNQEVQEELYKVNRKCGNITRVYSLPQRSVKNNPIYVIEISDLPGQHENMEPEMKYVANMHGNEVSGRELLLRLAHELCDKYLAGDADIRALITSTRIHLLPTMNPDGWDMADRSSGRNFLTGRDNANGVDLNRDFPDLDALMYQLEKTSPDLNHHINRIPGTNRLDHEVQPETAALMGLIMSTPFVLSANLHNGALVANYPYDESRMRSPHAYSKTPDDNVFRMLAHTYANNHPRMHNFRGCDDTDNFEKDAGITNGAKWYSVSGGMQDFNYLASNAMEITLELGCEKFPTADKLEGEWMENRKPLIEFMWKTHIGIKGQVTDDEGNPLSGAIVHATNVTDPQNPREIQHDVTTAAHGDYWRLLTPGSYEIQAGKPGYRPQGKQVQVTDLGHKEAPVVNFKLEKIPENEEIPQLDDNLLVGTDNGEEWGPDSPRLFDPEELDRMRDYWLNLYYSRQRF